jgi:hypothetical protein
VADVTEVEDPHGEPDDTDPGRGSVAWTGPGTEHGAVRPTPKHKAPRVVRDSPEASGAGSGSGGTVLGMVAGLLVVLLVASNIGLWVRSNDGGDASRAARVAVQQSRLARQLDDLQASVDDLKGSLNTLQQSVASTSTTPLADQLAALQARTDALVACVNTYMDALAGWTRNIASAFIYTRC